MFYTAKKFYTLYTFYTVNHFPCGNSRLIVYTPAP